MCAPDIPAPPSPKETSAAQTGTNVATAIANAMMGNVNRVGPHGTNRFDQTGNYDFTDPYTGKSYDIPTFTETVELTPEQQGIFDKWQGAQGNLAGLAEQQSGFLQDYMAEPINLDNESVEARLYELGAKRLDPRFARQQEELRTNLINRGIGEGSDAWSAAMSDFDAGQNDAYNNLLLQGRSQAVQEALAERNQPLNEIASLLSGSQVQTPQFSGANMPTIPTTDTAGLINQSYNQNVNRSMAQHQAGQNMLGGLFGLGSSLLMSDERVKEDVEEVGKTDDGQPIYKYRYKGHPLMQLGLMAQDVERKKPGAVKEVRGIKMVDYSKALEDV